MSEPPAPQTLAGLRLMSAMFVLADLVLLAAALALAPGLRTVAPGTALAAAAVGALALGCGLVIGRLRARPLEGRRPGEVAASYRRRFFATAAVAQAPAVAAFAVFLVVGSGLALLSGFGFTLLTWLLIVPTGADLRRRQRQLRARGVRVDLRAALERGLPRRPQR